MWAEKEIGDSMSYGLEKVSQLAQGEFDHDITLLKTKLHNVRIIFDWHWIVGCCIALLAAISSNLGLNLQRLSHLENDYVDPFATPLKKRPESEQRHVLVRPRWVAGMLLQVLGSLSDFAALSFAAQSLVASLGSLSLVANALIAPIILKERITSRMWKAIVLIGVGDCCCVLFGQHKSEVYTLDGLLSLYESEAFAVYAVIVFLAIVTLWCSIQFIQNKYVARNVDQPDDRLSRDAGTDAGQDDLTLRYTYQPHSYTAKFHSFSHAMLSGIFGAQSVLLGKSFAELVKSMFAGRGFVFSHVGTYVIIVCMFSCIFFQVYYLNEGLARFQAVVVIPIFQTFWTLVSVVGGFVLYKEFAEMKLAQVAMFCFGLMLTITGVRLMSMPDTEDATVNQTASDRRNGSLSDDSPGLHNDGGDAGNVDADASGDDDEGENSGFAVESPGAKVRSGATVRAKNSAVSSEEGWHTSRDELSTHAFEEDEQQNDETAPLLAVGAAPPSTPTPNHRLPSACSIPGMIVDSAQMMRRKRRQKVQSSRMHINEADVAQSDMSDHVDTASWLEGEV